MTLKVAITGVGFLSQLDDGLDSVAQRLPRVADLGALRRGMAFSSYPVGEEVPNRSDQRAMGPTMQAACYAAGKALRTAGLRDDTERLAATDLISAGRCTERDNELDASICRSVAETGPSVGPINSTLRHNLRPSLFLTQLPNLISANISIVHGVTGHSQTFLGEEPAGMAAIATAFHRIADGRAHRCLVGGVFCAEGPGFQEAVGASSEAIQCEPASAAAYLVLEGIANNAPQRLPDSVAISYVWDDALDRNEPDFFERVAQIILEQVRNLGERHIRFYTTTGLGAACDQLEDEIWSRVEAQAEHPINVVRLNRFFGAMLEAALPTAVVVASQDIPPGAVGVILGLGTFLGECVVTVERH